MTADALVDVIAILPVTLFVAIRKLSPTPDPPTMVSRLPGNAFNVFGPITHLLSNTARLATSIPRLK